MRERLLNALAPGFFSVLAGLLITAPLSLVFAQGQGGGIKVIEEGQPPVVIHGTVGNAIAARQAAAHGVGGASASKNLYYHGGSGGTGVETAPKIYVVFWGAQWNNNDPSGEASILTSFYGGVGGSSWLNSVTQYCQGVASGTVSCNGKGIPAGNPKGILAGTWYDNSSSAPSRPKP